MKNNYLKSSAFGLMLVALFTLASFTSSAEGCVFHQDFGPERTFVTDGTVAQTFTSCEDGVLAYVSLFMQSTEDTPFGTYLNIYSVDNTDTPLHTQQVVVPASYQKPYSKIWLTHELPVSVNEDYLFEIEVPSNRDVMFYHSDNNIYNNGNFVLNKENTSGDLAFEFGINKKSFFEISNQNNRSDLELWTPNLPEEYGCVATQRYYNAEVEMMSAASQTFTACRSGELTDVLINATFGQDPQQQGNLTILVYDQTGSMIGHTVYDPSADDESFIAVSFENLEVVKDQEYQVRLTMANNQDLNLLTVDSEQYFQGTMTLNNQPIDQNMCFYTVISSPVDDTEETDDEINDEEHTVSLDVQPPKEVEELRHTIYPNPFGSSFRLSVDTESDVPAVISVYNFMGNKVYETQVDDVSLVQDLLISPEGELSKGYYTLRIEYGDNIVLDTVIKQ